MKTQTKCIVCCLCFLLGIGISSASAIEDGLVSALKSDALDSALHTRIAHFSCEDTLVSVLNVHFGEATGIAVGIITGDSWKPPYTIVSLDMRDVTPAEILDQIVQQDPRYIWVPVDGNYVNILPVQTAEDKNSWINKPVGMLSMTNLALAEAIEEVRAMRYENVDPATGMIRTSNLVGHPTDQRYHRELDGRKISVNFQGGTLLDLMNQVFIEAGPDVGWADSGKFMGFGSRNLSKVRTTALVEAEQLAKSHGSRSQAIAAYKAAFEDAPFVELKAVAMLKMAETHLDSQFTSSSTNPKAAAQLYESLLAADLPGNSGVYAGEEFVRRYSSALLASGRSGDAEDFLLKAIDSPSLTERLGGYTLRNALMMYDVADADFQTALIRLERKRRLLPSDKAFQNELEDCIKITRINAKEEAKWKNIKPGTLVKTSLPDFDSESPNE